MNTIVRTAAVAAVGAAVLAGCSSSSNPAAKPSSSKATHKAAPVVVAAPTPSPTGPTVGQFASIVAKDGAGIKTAVRNIAPCQDIYGGSDLTCSVGWMTVSLRIEILRIDLASAVTPSAIGYLGKPPAEVAPLVRDTVESTKLMKRAEVLLTQYCDAQPNLNLCDSATLTWVSAKEQVLSEIAGWSPYTR